MLMLHLSLLRRATTGVVLFLLLLLASLVSHSLLEHRLIMLITGIEMGRLLVSAPRSDRVEAIPGGRDHATG